MSKLRKALAVLVCMAMVMAVVPCVALAAEESVSYEIAVDETFSFENVDILAHEIAGLNRNVDYVMYYKDGSVKEYNWNARPGKLEVPAGGKAVITSTELNISAAVADEYFLIKKEANPVMAKITIGVYESCTFKNTSDVEYKILTDSNYTYYDCVILDSEGTVSSYERETRNSSINIPAGYSVKITQTSGSKTFNGLYDKFTVSKDDTPVMRKVTLSPGETYTYTNTSDIEYAILTDSNYTYYDCVLYYSNDKVKETLSQTRNNYIPVPAGGKIKITQEEGTRTFNGLYDKFTLAANTVLENYVNLEAGKSYVVANDDTVDKALTFKSSATNDYIIYGADGSIDSYAQTSGNEIKIPRGGKAYITPNPLTVNSFVLGDKVTVTKRGNPVYNTVHMNPGDVYTYINNGSRDLPVYKNGLSCDYVIHNADKSINSYGANSTNESYTIPIGGSITIEAQDYITVKGLYDYFTVIKADAPVFDNVFFDQDDTYTFTNSAVKDLKLFINGQYDFIIYKADDSIDGWNNSASGELAVTSGYKVALTPVTSNMSVYALNEAYSHEPRSYPALVRIPVFYGSAVTVKNAAEENRNIYSCFDGYVDYTTRDEGGNVQEAKELTITSPIKVPALGTVEFVARGSNITYVGPYEAFSGEDTTVKVSGVTLSDTDIELKVGEQILLKAAVEPTDATNKNVSWSSSNSTVATVAQTGKVTAKAEGTATITVITEDGDFTADCFVTVTSDEPDKPDDPVQPATKTKFTNVNNYFVFDVAAGEVLAGKVLVIALYGENGVLLDLVNVPQTRELTGAYVVMKANPAAKTAKVLLWNGFVTALPDAPCEVVKL